MFSTHYHSYLLGAVNILAKNLGNAFPSSGWQQPQEHLKNLIKGHAAATVFLRMPPVIAIAAQQLICIAVVSNKEIPLLSKTERMGKNKHIFGFLIAADDLGGHLRTKRPLKNLTAAAIWLRISPPPLVTLGWGRYLNRRIFCFFFRNLPHNLKWNSFKIPLSYFWRLFHLIWSKHLF